MQKGSGERKKHRNGGASWKPIVYAGVGGSVAGVAGLVARRAGVSPTTVAVVTTAAGLVGAGAMRGNMRAAAIGVAVAGGVDLVVRQANTYLDKRDAEAKKKKAELAAGRQAGNPLAATDAQAALDAARNAAEARGGAAVPTLKLSK